MEKVKSVLRQVFTWSMLEERFSAIGFLPRRVIFCIDVCILIFANTLCYYLLSNLTLSFYDTLDVPTRYGIIIMVNVCFFLVFKTYLGIVRYSTFADSIKLLVSTVFSFLVIVSINYFAFFVFGKMIYLWSELFINFVVTFTSLFQFRIMVRYFFENILKERVTEGTTRALVYGADANAIFMAKALMSEVPLRFKLVGFINKKSNKSSKTLLDLPLLSNNKKIPVLLRSMNAEVLILADKSLSNAEKTIIVDQCLEYNFKVFILPEITDWEDQKEITKKVKKFQIQDLLERKPIVLDNNGISNQIRSRTVLITGAAGSIGSEIVWQVQAFNPSVIVILDQAETPLHNLCLEIEKISSTAKIHAVIADIRNKVVMEAVFKQYKPCVVFHAAAYKHVPLMEANPAQAVFTNVSGTKNLADLSVKYNVDKFVMVSTDKAVNPSNVMGASKRIAEKYVQSLYFSLQKQGGKHTRFITTRFGNVLGSNGSVVPLFTRQIEAGGPITITHPDIIRYFMTIPEACQLVLEAGAMGNGGEIFIFDMGKPVKIIDLANKMIRLAGFIPDQDIKIEIVGLRPGEKLYEELLNDSSKTLPTHHEKIMIAEDYCDNFSALTAEVDELIGLAATFDNHIIVDKMKVIVPEFISMNSDFEILDNNQNQ